MRLLLDEHYSPEIAKQLRARGHDVIGVKQEPRLMNTDDDALLQLMASEHRAIATENVGDFARAIQKATAGETPHYGVVFVSASKYRRSDKTIRVIVQALDTLLRQHPAEDALLNSARWL